jgi:hypothetical protein
LATKRIIRVELPNGKSITWKPNHQPAVKDSVDVINFWWQDDRTENITHLAVNLNSVAALEVSGPPSDFDPVTQNLVEESRLGVSLDE